MGRKKIKIRNIEDDRCKTVTFARRRSGLIKKAHELSVLCECEVALLMFDSKDQCHVFSSSSAETLVNKYMSKDFKATNHPRKRDGDDDNASGETNTASSTTLINEYRVFVNGDGSDDIVVKQSNAPQPLPSSPPILPSPQHHFRNSSPLGSISRHRGNSNIIPALISSPVKDHHIMRSLELPAVRYRQPVFYRTMPYADDTYEKQTPYESSNQDEHATDSSIRLQSLVLPRIFSRSSLDRDALQLPQTPSWPPSTIYPSPAEPFTGICAESEHLILPSWAQFE